MPWKKGQSGNPHGRRIDLARRLLEAGMSPHEHVYIPILDKRDPAKELVKLADKSKDASFKRGIWEFLFQEKYKGSKIVAKLPQVAVEEGKTDAEMIRELEGNTGLETQQDALNA